MAGKSNKDIHPYMLKLMRLLGCANLTEMSRVTGIKRSTLDEYAFGGRVPSVPNARMLSDATGVPAEEIIMRFMESRLLAG